MKDGAWLKRGIMYYQKKKESIRQHSFCSYPWYCISRKFWWDRKVPSAKRERCACSSRTNSLKALCQRGTRLFRYWHRWPFECLRGRQNWTEVHFYRGPEKKMFFKGNGFNFFIFFFFFNVQKVLPLWQWNRRMNNDEVWWDLLWRTSIDRLSYSSARENPCVKSRGNAGGIDRWCYLQDSI